MTLVDIRREEHVCVVTLQREEKLNALSGAMERELLDAWLPSRTWCWPRSAR